MALQTQSQGQTVLSVMSTSTKHVKLSEIEQPTKWKPPKKPPFRQEILDDPDVKDALLRHEKQSPLDRIQAEKAKSSPKRRLCIDMLKQGYHKSFRELDVIFRLQIDERNRLGSEHPVWDRPLLDQEIEKLQYLCSKLNSAEAAERAGNFKILFRHYNDAANYFLARDDGWLSDFFLDKCLKIAKEKLAASEPSCLAEAHANLGLAFERQTNDYTAKSDRIRESYLKSLEHFEAYHQLSESQDWSLPAQSHDLSKADQAKLEAIRRESVESFLLEDHFTAQNMFVDSCIHLQRLYRIVSSRYARNSLEKIEYLKKAFQVCKKSSIGPLEGQASFLLGTTHEDIGDHRAALSYFANDYEISRRDKDLVNLGKASEALAKTHEKLGQINKSIEILEQYLQEVTNTDANEQYSRACDCLAVIYNSLGKYETASEYARKSFEASRRINNTKHLEYNRVLFGVSNAHKNLKLFEKNVELANRKTISNLIHWKYDSKKEKLLREIDGDDDDEIDENNTTSENY